MLVVDVVVIINAVLVLIVLVVDTVVYIVVVAVIAVVIDVVIAASETQYRHSTACFNRYLWRSIAVSGQKRTVMTGAMSEAAFFLTIQS